MRLSFFFAIVAAAASLFMTSCGIAGGSGGQSMADIMATIEKLGFTCEVKDRHPKTVVQVGQCRANQDKYLLLTVSQWNDPKARDQMYEQKLPKICDKIGVKDQLRWSTAGDWLLVAGASKEKDVKALDDATNALGFEPHAVACD